MIRAEGVVLAPGGDVLLDEVSLHVRPGARVALVGRNGTGKSTLLRALAGLVEPAEGRIALREGCRIGWLPQQAVSGSTASVWDEARSALEGLVRLRARLEAAEEALSDDAEASALAHAQALEAFTAAGGFAEDERVGSVLHGLGFGPEDWSRPCAELSGGWQMRVALARVLLAAPDVALLDEPTNHLDASARSWLAGELVRSRGALVVASHDRHLLDAVATEVVEVRAGRLHRYAMGYTASLRERDARALASARAAEAHAAEVARLTRFVARFGAKASKAAAANAMEKRIERLGPAHEVEAVAPTPRLALPAAPPGDAIALSLRAADVGWADRTVLSGVTLDLERGMRLALVGPNGAGKSTLLAALAGTSPLRSGRRVPGERLRIGLFHQDLAAALPRDVTPLEHLAARAPRAPTVQLRAALGALGLSGDDALRPMATLSGGEAARVALAALVAAPANVLLLDEPTNHLDLVAIEALCDGLAAWEGTVVLATHDRWLVERLATHVGRIERGRLDVRAGVRAEDFEPLRAASPAAAVHEDRRRVDRSRERAGRRADALIAEIDALERRLREIDDAGFDVGGDWVRAAELDRERRDTAAALEERTAAWEQAMTEASAPGDPP
jgi:ATP-binding cassette subfamily F protein 3